MAKHEWLEDAVGGSRDSTAFNLTMTDFVTAGALVDGTNIREEGLDNRAILDPMVTQAWTPVRSDLLERFTPAGAGTWTTLTDGVTTFSSGAFTLPSKATLLVVAQLNWRQGPANDGIPANARAGLRLRIQISGGGASVIDPSTRQFNGGSARGVGMSGTVWGWVTNASAGIVAYDFVELQITEFTGPVQLQYSHPALYGTIYHRTIA